MKEGNIRLLAVIFVAAAAANTAESGTVELFRILFASALDTAIIYPMIKCVEMTIRELMNNINNKKKI